VRLLQTQHLLVQAQNVGAVRVSGGRREVVAVVDGVHRREAVFRRKHVVHSRVAEVLAYGLQGTAEDLGDAVEIGRVRGRRDPEIQQRLHAGCSVCAGSQVRHEGCRRLMKVLDEYLEVSEEEGLVFLNRAAESSAELIALEGRRGTEIEVGWERRERCCADTRTPSRGTG